MNGMSLFQSEDVIIVRSEYTGAKDRGGNEVATETRIPSSAIVHIGNVVQTVEPYMVVNDSQITLLFPENTEIKENDQFIVRTSRWEIDGEPFNIYPEIENRFIPMPVIVKIKQRKGDTDGL